MPVLAIETTGTSGGLALWHNGSLLAELAVSSRETHSRRLIPSIKWLLERAEVDMQELEHIAVSLGPGSFTGIRIGLATARGISLALSVPLAGVPTLDILAASFPPMPGVVVCPVIDARNNRFYSACYFAQPGVDKWKRIKPFTLGDASELLAQVTEAGVLEGAESIIFSGSALKQCQEDLAREFSAFNPIFAPEWMWLPDAATLAAISFRYLSESGDSSTISPVYVKLSQAEEMKLARQGRV